jgi:hypothetical protein
MNEEVRSIVWEAPEHRHIEKTTDWYWAVGIIAISTATASIMFKNVLFGLVILLGASTMILFSHRTPKMLPYEISPRGLRIKTTLYPFISLEAFALDEDAAYGPQLILKSQHFLMPLIIVPIPEEYVDEIDDIISSRLREAHLEEPLSHRLLEFFGF